MPARDRRGGVCVSLNIGVSEGPERGPNVMSSVRQDLMMRGLMVRGLILGLCLSAMLGCSWFPTFDDVMPDRNKEYQKSASLPDLEIPPDLSSDAISDTLSVPEVDAKGTASYSTYQERIARRGGDEQLGRDSDAEGYGAPAAPPSPAEESLEDTEVPTPEDATALDDSRADDIRSEDDRDERIADEDAAGSSPADEEEPASEPSPSSSPRPGPRPSRSPGPRPSPSPRPDPMRPAPRPAVATMKPRRSLKRIPKTRPNVRRRPPQPASARRARAGGPSS